MKNLGRQLALGLGLAVLTVLGHGFSLKAGLFLDDHAHFANLRNGDWSFRSAVDAAYLGIVKEVLDLWGAPEAGLRFFRPIAFWTFRLEYTLVDWLPAGMHAFSLAWHTLNGLLVAHLAHRLLRSWLWAGVAAAWFVVHPGHVVSVQWIACQTELMVTAFTLSAVLCYARGAGWWTRRDPNVAATVRRPGVWRALAVVWFALALGCRENAVVIPAICVVGDAFFRRGTVWRRPLWGTCVAFVLVFAAYWLLRHAMLSGFPLPGKPYLFSPGDPGFVAFAATKALYYFLGLFAYFPVVPLGGLSYLRDHPMFLYSSLAFVGIPLLLMWSSLRRHRGFGLAGLWMVLAIGVMSLVFASPHHLYLPGVGAAVLFAAALARLAGDTTTSTPRRRTLAFGLVAVHAAVCLSASIGFGWVFRTGIGVEREVVGQVRSIVPKLRNGDHLFFINLPMLAHYVGPAVQTDLGLTAIRAHALTLSPHVLGVKEPCRIVPIDDQTFEVELDGSPYFSGRSGRALLDVMGREEPFRAGDYIRGERFDVTVIEADERGVSRLRFRFHRPLADERYRFFFGSRAGFAYPISFTNDSRSRGPAD